VHDRQRGGLQGGQPAVGQGTAGPREVWWKVSSARIAASMRSSPVTAGPSPSWVSRSPQNSVRVSVSKNMCDSQLCGTCGVASSSIRRDSAAPPMSRTSPSASGLGGRTGR
jgi:hypothetical protein